MTSRLGLLKSCTVIKSIFVVQCSRHASCRAFTYPVIRCLPEPKPTLNIHQLRLCSTSDEKGSKLDLAKPGNAAKKKQEIKQAAEASESSSSSDSDGESSSSDSDDELTSAAKEAAQSLGGDVSATESDLLQKLREHQTLTKEQKEGKMPPSVANLGAIFGGMRVERKQFRRGGGTGGVGGQQQQPGQEWRGGDKQGEGGKPWERGQRRGEMRDGRRDGGRREMRDRPRRPPRDRMPDVQLFDGPRLGIFSAPEESQVAVKEDTYSAIESELRERNIRMPAANAFQEQITWTQEGKAWKFPITNEEGLEHERAVPFYEHVFLDQHLEKDFPKTGPVRHFMELVCVGLSKNPYITVQQKIEHIEWFRVYFSDKLDIIEEALQVKS